MLTHLRRVFPLITYDDYNVLVPKFRIGTSSWQTQRQTQLHLFITLWTICLVHGTGNFTRYICLTTRSLRMTPSRLVVRPEHAPWKVSTPGRGVTGGLLRCPRAGAVTTNFCAAQRLTTVALRARGLRLRDGKSWRMPRLKIWAPIYARGCVFIGDTATRPDAGCPRSVLPWSVLVVLFYSKDKTSTLLQRVDHNKGFGLITTMNSWTTEHNNGFVINHNNGFGLITTMKFVLKPQWLLHCHNDVFGFITTINSVWTQQWLWHYHSNVFSLITTMTLVTTQQWI